MIKSPLTLETADTPPDAAGGVCDVRHSAEAVGPLRQALVSERAAEALAATFSVLGDPTRVRLLDALAQQEMCVCELAELVDSSESAVSHQLRLLRSLRLVRSRRSGRLVFYRLDDEHIRRLLDQGRRHIEEETGGRDGDRAGLASETPHPHPLPASEQREPAPSRFSAEAASPAARGRREVAS